MAEHGIAGDQRRRRAGCARARPAARPGARRSRTAGRREQVAAGRQTVGRPVRRDGRAGLVDEDALVGRGARIQVAADLGLERSARMMRPRRRAGAQRRPLARAPPAGGAISAAQTRPRQRDQRSMQPPGAARRRTSARAGARCSSHAAPTTPTSTPRQTAECSSARSSTSARRSCARSAINQRSAASRKRFGPQQADGAAEQRRPDHGGNGPRCSQLCCRQLLQPRRQSAGRPASRHTVLDEQVKELAVEKRVQRAAPPEVRHHQQRAAAPRTARTAAARAAGGGALISTRDRHARRRRRDA